MKSRGLFVLFAGLGILHFPLAKKVVVLHVPPYQAGM